LPLGKGGHLLCLKPKKRTKLKLNKAYKFRIYPNKEQSILLNKTFGSVRFIYNKMLYDKINKWFPSSKTCSNCNNIKQDLQLFDRVYECSYCGLVINRDYNAALNIRRVGTTHIAC